MPRSQARASEPSWAYDKTWCVRILYGVRIYITDPTIIILEIGNLMPQQNPYSKKKKKYYGFAPMDLIYQMWRSITLRSKSFFFMAFGNFHLVYFGILCTRIYSIKLSFFFFNIVLPFGFFPTWGGKEGCKKILLHLSLLREYFIKRSESYITTRSTCFAYDNI